MNPRVVDRDNQPWRLLGEHEHDTRYTPELDTDLGVHTYEQLDDTRGPLRPVEPMHREDESRLRDAFDRAGHQAVATLAAALETVHNEHRHHRGGTSAPQESYGYARRSMTAGRPGSWESDALISVINVGSRFTLPTPEEVAETDLDARRAAGPSARVHRDAFQILVRLLRHWTSHPGEYTEVAGNLAGAMSRYADERHGADGWNRVSDQWLRPESLPVDDFRDCYRLLYSQSGHFDPALLG